MPLVAVVDLTVCVWPVDRYPSGGVIAVVAVVVVVVVAVQRVRLAEGKKERVRGRSVGVSLCLLEMRERGRGLGRGRPTNRTRAIVRGSDSGSDWSDWLLLLLARKEVEGTDVSEVSAEIYTHTPINRRQCTRTRSI